MGLGGCVTIAVEHDPRVASEHPNPYYSPKMFGVRPFDETVDIYGLGASQQVPVCVRGTTPALTRNVGGRLHEAIGASFAYFNRIDEWSMSATSRAQQCSIDWPKLVAFMQSDGATTCHPTASECLAFLDRMILATRLTPSVNLPKRYVLSLHSFACLLARLKCELPVVSGLACSGAEVVDARTDGESQPTTTTAVVQQPPKRLKTAEHDTTAVGENDG